MRLLLFLFKKLHSISNYRVSPGVTGRIPGCQRDFDSACCARKTLANAYPPPVDNRPLRRRHAVGCPSRLPVRGPSRKLRYHLEMLPTAEATCSCM